MPYLPPGFFEEISDALRAFEPRVCLECGCTDTTPCVIDGVPCHWISDTLCSVCAANEPLVELYSEGDLNNLLSAAGARVAARKRAAHG